MKLPDDIFLLIGQSNMAGRGALSTDTSAPLDGVFVLDPSGEWKPASNSLNRFSTIIDEKEAQGVGPGYGFARVLRNHATERTIGLIVNAKGGTGIDEWMPGTFFYEEAVRRTRQIGKPLRAILWHQGERNKGNPRGHAEKLALLVKALRRDLGQQDLPFLAGEIAHTENADAINSQLNRFPTLTQHAVCISAGNLTTFDNLHFDTPSQIELGSRYAEAFLRLNNIQNSPTAPAFSQPNALP